MTDSSRKPFSDLLSELIELYRKLQKEENLEQSNINVDGDVDFLINHYNSIKDNIDDETFEALGEPVRDLMENLLNELRKETTVSSSETDEEEISTADLKQKEINRIDQQLKHANLSEKEINNLLDQRAKLI